MKKKVIILLAVSAALIILGVIFKSNNYKPLQQSNNTLTLQTSVSQLPKRAVRANFPRLAAGLIPPTNKWFSSLALASDDQPVYSYPLSIKPSEDGFSFGVPKVVSSSDAIFGSHLSDIKVSYNTTSRIVSGYDDLSVTIDYASGKDKISKTRLDKTF